jgi:RNA polymerase subunit RPABC4/transcription elongation factor Spt4
MNNTCPLCSSSSFEIWIILPDEEHGDKYPYPLKDAQFCPVCGKTINKESLHGEPAS